MEREDGRIAARVASLTLEDLKETLEGLREEFKELTEHLDRKSAPGILIVNEKGACVKIRSGDDINMRDGIVGTGQSLLKDVRGNRGGDIEGSMILVGNGASLHQGSTIEDLRALIAEFRRELPAADLDPETREDVEEAATAVERQLARDTPKRSVVLSYAKMILDLLSSAAAAGKSLVPLAQRLSEMAASVLV